MKKAILFLSLILTSVSACGMSFGNVTVSPFINIRNLSNNELYNLKVNWAGKHVLIPEKLDSGKGLSQTINIGKVKDFYGNVYLTWQNASGKKFEKTFEFTENDLPVDYIIEVNKPRKERDPTKRFADVTLELYQDHVDMYTSATPGFEERSKAATQKMKELRKAAQ